MPLEMTPTSSRDSSYCLRYAEPRAAMEKTITDIGTCEDTAGLNFVCLSWVKHHVLAEAEERLKALSIATLGRQRGNEKMEVCRCFAKLFV